MARVPVAKVNDCRLFYEVYGSGPPLLLAPGLPQISSDWFPFADALAERFTVVVYDNRGSGRSEEPEGWYSISLMAADAAGLLDHLKVERAHVFGTSMGGMIAQELAIGWGDRIARLVLGCTHAGGSHAVQPDEEVGRAFALATRDWGERVAALVPYAFSPAYLESHRDAVSRFVEKKSRDAQSHTGYRKQYGAANRHDSFDRLGGIRRPTLVITGTQDRVVPPRNSRILCEAIPDARLAEIEAAGHLFFVEQPEATLALLLPFLEGRAPR